MRPSFLLAPLVLSALVAGCASGPPPPHDGEVTPPFLPVEPGDLVALRTVRVDPFNRCVLAEGWVNQVEGLVELLACGPEGKTHESVLVLDVDPVDMHAAFLLLGLRPGTPPRAPGVGRPEGHPVDIWVAWDEGGDRRVVRGETLLHDRVSGQVLPRSPWVYTGLVGEDGRPKAAVDQSLVATFWDPWALLNLPLPAGADDEILFAHTSGLPPCGTPVTVRLQPVPQP